MPAYFIDLITVSLLIIGIVALMGTITNGIGHALFGSKKNRFTDMNGAMTNGFRKVGGKK